MAHPPLKNTATLGQSQSIQVAQTPPLCCWLWLSHTGRTTGVPDGPDGPAPWVNRIQSAGHMFVLQGMGPHQQAQHLPPHMAGTCAVGVTPQRHWMSDWV
jgi:hypothetical protein